ncbi:MAG: T9SS type A sorting domain-containing protein [Bacteroidota bacterium]
MQRNLTQLLKQYRSQLESLELTTKKAGKFTIAGSAALATMIAGPVELNSQIVAGNLGAPTRTGGPCEGALGAFGFDCALFDFDHDGQNELQVRYYNYSGVYPAASWYAEPLNNYFAKFGKGPYAAAYGYTFPGTPGNTQTNYQPPQYGLRDRIIVVPLTGGNGYGFVTFDVDFYSIAGGTHQPNHPVSGQPICCWSYGGPVLWGAQTGLSSLSDIQILTDDINEAPSFPNLLPVELTHFSAQAQKQEVELHWETATETANAGFEIERSLDGRRFELLEFVEGQGTTSEAHRYQFTDKSVKAGNQYYYRLKQVDYDGSFTYSEVRMAHFKGDQLQINIFPNPASDWINLHLLVEETGEVVVSLFSSQGQLIYNQTETVQANGVFRKKIDINELVAGVYFLKVEVNGESVYERVVK